MATEQKAYAQLLSNALELIQEARVQTAFVINRQQVHLYYRLGKIIIEKQESESWGKNIVEPMSRDIQKRLGLQKVSPPQFMVYAPVL